MTVTASTDPKQPIGPATAPVKKMICPRCWGSKLERHEPRQCGYCFGDGVKDDVKLSPHFWLSECLRSQTATRNHLANNPDDFVIANLKDTCAMVEPVRVQFGPMTVNSGYRSPELNSAVGGSNKMSVHGKGNALDLDPVNPGVKHSDVMNWIIASGMKYDQLIYEGSWIHIGRLSPSGAQRRENLMMFPDSKGKPAYFKYDPKDPRVIL